LKRVPAIENLKFAGGMPFADETTKQWIDETVMAGPAGGEGGGARRGSGSADGTSKELDEALGQARELAAEGKLTEAIDLLQNGPPRSRSLRQSFLWRAALARVIQESGKARLTRPLWESLLEDIDRFKLDAWEPELSVPVLNSLYRALKSDKETASRAEEIFARLCRVDLNAALGLDKG
jgi:type VI secretion system protein VasJ